MTIQSIRADHLSRKFEKEYVLHDLDAHFERGMSYAITGVSGTGKSTLLHLLAGIDMPSAGTVFYNNQSLQMMGQRERSAVLNKSIGLVFQAPYLLREFSVLENVMMPGLIAGKSMADCQERAQMLLAAVGVEGKEHAAPMTLSGGQQQRVAIARALFNEPDFLIADEPTGNLDEQTALHIIELLDACQKRWGMGLIVSSHDVQVARAMKQVLVVHNGRLEIKN